MNLILEGGPLYSIYYIDNQLVWTLLYTGDRDVRILELAISEYVIEGGKSI